MSPAKRNSPLFIGLHAARANLLPGFIVQTLMLAVVLSYYFAPAAAAPLQAIATIKATLGIPFAIGAAICAGAIAPERTSRPRQTSESPARSPASSSGSVTGGEQVGPWQR